MGKIEDIFKHLDEIEYEIKNKNTSIKDAHEDKLEDEFNAKLESYFKNPQNQDFIGKFDNYTSSANERIVNFKAMLDFCVEQTEKKIFKEGDDLYMKPRNAKNLLREAERMFSYDEKQALRCDLEAGRNNAQAYLNERSIGSKKENRESTMKGIKAKIQKINILESLGRVKKLIIPVILRHQKSFQSLGE